MKIGLAVYLGGEIRKKRADNTSPAISFTHPRQLAGNPLNGHTIQWTWPEHQTHRNKDHPRRGKMVTLQHFDASAAADDKTLAIMSSATR